MGTRTFVVRVSETEPRVIVEDVRSRERIVAVDLAGVPGAIAHLLDRGKPDRANPGRAAPRA